MQKKVLLSFESISHNDGDEWDIRHFSWKLHAGERVWIQCARDEQRQALWRIIQRNLKPKEGWVEEIHPVFTYSDELLASRLKWKKNMIQNLESLLFEEHVWIGNRRVFAPALFEYLCIDMPMRRMPLDELPKEIFHRYWGLLLVITKAKLLVVEKLFQELDNLSLQLIQEWQPSFAGALIVFGENSKYTEPFDTRLNVQADGRGEICH